MDRLARKGIVTRRKVGRAYRYQASLSADEARVSAIQKIVTGFFDGSAEALAAHLAAAGGAAHSLAPAPARPEPRGREPQFTVHGELPEAAEPSRRAPVDGTDTADKESVIRRLDETLL
jgi:hypothetical protein